MGGWLDDKYHTAFTSFRTPRNAQDVRAILAARPSCSRLLHVLACSTRHPFSGHNGIGRGAPWERGGGGAAAR
eukprot:2354257-Pyramimonas_sp.AAC.1